MDLRQLLVIVNETWLWSPKSPAELDRFWKCQAILQGKERPNFMQICSDTERVSARWEPIPLKLSGNWSTELFTAMLPSWLASSSQCVFEMLCNVTWTEKKTTYTRKLSRWNRICRLYSTPHRTVGSWNAKNSQLLCICTCRCTENVCC